MGVKRQRQVTSNWNEKPPTHEERNINKICLSGGQLKGNHRQICPPLEWTANLHPIEWPPVLVCLINMANPAVIGGGDVWRPLVGGDGSGPLVWSTTGPGGRAGRDTKY